MNLHSLCLGVTWLNIPVFLLWKDIDLQKPKSNLKTHHLFFCLIFLNAVFDWFCFFSLVVLVGDSSGNMTNVLDCNIVVSEFKLQSPDCIHLRIILEKGMNLLIPPAMGLIELLLCLRLQLPSLLTFLQPKWLWH